MKMKFEEFGKLWEDSRTSPLSVCKTSVFEILLYQTEIDETYRQCRIDLNEGAFKYLKARQMENLSTILQDRQFSIIVSNEDFFEVFDHLIFSIVDKLSEAESCIEVENVLIDSFRKYISLFSPKRKNIISMLAGLYGELLVLKQLILLKGSSVVKDWNGPDKNRHDFTFIKRSIEVKSEYRNYDEIAISNDFQLFIDPPEELYLKVFQLDIRESSSEDSMKDLISEVFDLCSNSEDKIALISKINELEISFQSDFSLEPALKIDVLNSLSYRVTDTFPKLTKESLPVGITHLKYSVQLSSIPKENKIEEDELWKQFQ